MLRSVTIPLLIILLAAGLRFNALSYDSRFHPDEALFATFARGAALNAEWWLPGSLDKPPLSIYATAVSMQIFASQQDENLLWDFDVHQGEFAARIPNTFANIVLVAVVYALAKNINVHPQRTRHVTARLAGLLIALSPFAIAFSATAFTDGLMLLWMSLALLAILRNRWGLSGVFLALSIAGKQQGILYLPLVIGIGWTRYGLSRRHAMRFLIPFMMGIVLLVTWDILRPGESIWRTAASHNNPQRVFIDPDEIIPRLKTWLDYGRVFAGPTWLTVLIVPLGIVGIVRYSRPLSGQIRILILCTGGFITIYWLIPFNTYDRYLLPLLPVIMIIVASGITRTIYIVGAQRIVPRQALVIITLIAFASPMAYTTSKGQTHIGGDLGQHIGIDELALYLNDKALGAIIYDRWLGWELDFYLGQWTDKRRVYYPTPQMLAEDALLQSDPAPRYFVALTENPHNEWLIALRDAGFSISVDYQRNRFIVYQLIPPTGPRDV